MGGPCPGSDCAAWHGKVTQFLIEGVVDIARWGHSADAEGHWERSKKLGRQANCHHLMGLKCKSPAAGRGFLDQVAGTWHPDLLGYDVGRAGAFLALLNVVRDALSLGQGFESTTLDGAVMDEDVLGAIGRGDEAEALFVTEPLNCTCSHYGYL